MKNRLFRIAATLALVSGFSLSSFANVVEDFFGWIATSAIGKVGEKVAEELCKKGDLTSGVFSIRSLGGHACSNKLIASVAEYICYPKFANGKLAEDKLGYLESGCHAKAIATLDLKDPSSSATLTKALADARVSAVKKAITTELGEYGSSAKGTVCTLLKAYDVSWNNTFPCNSKADTKKDLEPTPKKDTEKKDIEKDKKPETIEAK